MLGKVVRNHSMRHAGALHTPVGQNTDSESGIENFFCKGQPIIDVAQHQKLLQCQGGV